MKKLLIITLILALTATISYGQVLPAINPEIVGRASNNYTVIRDTIKSNLIISITGSPALLVIDGYTIRERIKSQDNWVLGANGQFVKYIGYLDEVKKPFSSRTLVWQFKLNE